MNALFTLIGVIVLMPLLAINTAYPMSQVWNMFGPLVGLPTITVPIAIGLSLLHSFFWTTTYYEDHKEDAGKMVGTALLKPWICLLLAWITFQFVEVKPQTTKNKNNGEPANVVHQTEVEE